MLCCISKIEFYFYISFLIHCFIFFNHNSNKRRLANLLKLYTHAASTSVGITLFNFQIKQDIQIIAVSVLIQQVYSLTDSVENLCFINLLNLWCLYHRTAGTQFMQYVNKGQGVSVLRAENNAFTAHIAQWTDLSIQNTWRSTAAFPKS